MGLAGGLIWQAARGTVTPWVVEIDKLGPAQAIAPAVADYRPTDPQIAWHLARFIENVRSIPADPVIVRHNWLAAYDFVTDKGAVALNDYARANDPFTKVGKIQVAGAVGLRAGAGALAGAGHRVASIASERALSSAGTGNPPAGSGGPPAWARKLRREQMMSHGVSTAAHAVRSSDHGGGSTAVDLKGDH